MCCDNSSALNAVAFTVLIIASLACSLSFVAPFWLIYPDRPGVPNISHIVSIDGQPKPVYPFLRATWTGLCAVCFREATLENLTGQQPSTNPICVWFAEDDFTVEKTLPDWYLATQCLFSAGLVFFLLALFCESFYACCGCCHRKSCLPTIVASFTIVAGVLVCSSLALFAGFSCSNKELTSVADGGHGGHLWWAFYVGISGVGAAILSAILFYCDGCRVANIYSDYKPPTVDKA